MNLKIILSKLVVKKKLHDHSKVSLRTQNKIFSRFLYSAFKVAS